MFFSDDETESLASGGVPRTLGGGGSCAGVGSLGDGASS